MRPLRLELEGFTSFRERTEVSFEDTNLFVFTGATGSGKSSLIDAMIFALYGSVPRYDDRRLVAPVISQGKVRARVRLDFEVRGRVYTAVRVIQRTKTGATTKEARLEKHANGEPARTLAATEAELSASVKTDVIGLDLDHFTKCVVLPQGEFAAFLRDKPGDREKLLKRLLGLGLYDKLRKAANLRGKLEDGRADQLRWQLESALAHATPEAVRAAEARVAALDQLRVHIDDVSSDLSQLDQTIQSAGDRWKKAAAQLELLAEVRVPEGVAELATRHREAEERLRKASEAKDAAAARLRAAQAARSDLPERAAIEKIVEKRQDLARAEAGITQIRSELGGAAEAAAHATRLEKSVRRDFTEAQESLKRLPARAELEGVRKARRQLRELERETEYTREKLAEAHQAHQASSVREKSVVEDLAQAQGVLAALPTKEGLEAVRERRERLARVEGEADGTRRELARAEELYAAAESSKATADQRLEGATQALEALRVAHSAADMARHLEQGKPCPVCLQSVVMLPEHDTPADLETALEAKSAATDACAGAQAELERRASRRTSCSATLELQERSARSLREVLVESPTRDEIVSLLARIVEMEAAVRDLETNFDHATRRRAQCELARNTAAEALRQHERFARPLREDLAGKPTDEEIDALLADITQAEEGVRLLEERVEEAGAQRAECERVLNAASARLDHQKRFAAELRAGLAEAPTPDETSALLGAISVADEALHHAQAEEESARRRLHEAEQELQRWQSRVSAAWQEYRNIRDVVAEIRPPAAVEGDLAVSWGALSDWSEEAYEAAGQVMVRADAERAAAAARKNDLDAELRERCRADGLSLEDGDEPATRCAGALGAAGRELDHLRRNAAERERVAREEKEARGRALIAKDLGSHLSAKKFGAWLQNQILTWLVQGATARLRELSSGQYSLDLSDKNEFLVIDHRNADEPRLAKTLSGGETFLASLALALSLAEQVANLAARGSAKLEALFLDEGFGTLDSETLDVVAATIEQLGTERMVGIVTHVPELADRIPIQYRVKKVGNSSSVQRVET